MKKHIITALGIIIFIVAYFLWGSWKISLLIIAVLFIYLVWVLGFEMGLFNSKDEAERLSKQTKEDHTAKTKDNPTLR